jgi:hypothetical protein
MNVFEIIKAHLKTTGLDGICNTDSECACDKDDLSPGDCLTGECRTGKWFSCVVCGERWMMWAPGESERCGNCST